MVYLILIHCIDNIKTTYSFESLSDGTYVSDDQLSAITVISSTNDETEAEGKHEIFHIDEYSTSNFDNINTKSEFLSQQLFDINNQNLNESYNELINKSSILNDKSFILNLNSNEYLKNNSNRDELLDINFLYGCKDSDENNSTKSNYGISDDTYINSDNFEIATSSDHFLDHRYLLDFDDEHYRNLKESDTKFCNYLNDDENLFSSLCDVSDICSEVSIIDVCDSGSEKFEEDEDDDIEIIIASEQPTPPPLYYKKMAEIRKIKKAMLNENENNNSVNNINNNGGNNNNNMSSSKRHKKHKFNRSNHSSKYNKGSTKSLLHCEPSVISIDDYIDHSSNSIFYSNKKKKNSKYNKSKSSTNVNNSNTSTTENKSKTINHTPSRDENNELSSSWPSLASLYLSSNNNNNNNNKNNKNIINNNNNDNDNSNNNNNDINNNTKSNKKTRESNTNDITDSSSFLIDNHNIPASKNTHIFPSTFSITEQNKNSTSTPKYPERISYLSILSNIKSSSLFNSPSISVKVKEDTNDAENTENSHSDNDKLSESGGINGNHSLSSDSKQFVDYIITSKNSTTCVTSVTPSLFLVNCPDSIKDNRSNYKKLSFFSRDSLSESKKEFENKRHCSDNNELLVDIRKDDIIVSKPQQSNLTKSISQSNLIDKSMNSMTNSSLDEIEYSTSISSTTLSNIMSPMLDSSLSFSLTSVASSDATTSSLTLSNLNSIPFQLSTITNAHIAIPSPSLSSNFSVTTNEDVPKSSLIHDLEDTLNCPTPLPPPKIKTNSYVKNSNSSSRSNSSADTFIVSRKSDVSLITSNGLSSNLDDSCETVEVSYSLDSTKTSTFSVLDNENENENENKIENENNNENENENKNDNENNKSKDKEVCACRCNTYNHYCSFIDHKFKLIREKRRLIKSAINCGFLNVHLKDEPPVCDDDDENSSNCDSTIHTRNKNNKEEENEREDIMNTILLSHTDFSTFPEHLKFTINTHDIWLKWTNLEINRDRFKDGRLL